MKVAASVMVIHESDAARDRMGAALGKAGLVPILRPTPIGAQAQILRERPDIVVIDAAMPLMSGAEFTRAIRAHASMRQTVVLLAAPSAIGLAVAARECGADGTVVHSTPDELVRTVQAWLAKGRRKTDAQSGYVLVACGLAQGRELGRAMQERIAVRVTDSGMEALRLLFTRDAPASLWIGTALADLEPRKIFDAALELDRKWSRRIAVVREHAVAPGWASALTSIDPRISVEEALVVASELRGL